MGIEDLSELEILHGSFSLTFVIISLIIGILFIVKYKSTKRVEHITLGLTWIFISSGWFGSSFSFLSIILFDYAFDTFLYLFLANVFLPLTLITWLYSFCHILYPEWEKRILIIVVPITVLIEIFLIAFLFIDPSVIGRIEGKFYSQTNPAFLVFELTSLLVFLITGLILSIKSIKFSDPIIQLRGKLLLIAFISLTIAALIDSFILVSPIILVFARLLLISCALEYYLGFFLPNRLKRRLLKEPRVS